MMTLHQALLSFAVVAGLLTLVPGLDTALVLRSAVTRSRSYAFATALGINTGAIVWGIFAAVGVTALLAASEFAYTLLTFAGAAYMIWLGLSLFWKSLRSDQPAGTREGQAQLPTAAKLHSLRGWAAGAGTNLLNPKVGVFYIATIPQFIPPGTSPLLMGMLLAETHCVLAIAGYTLLNLCHGLHVEVAKWGPQHADNRSHHRFSFSWLRCKARARTPLLAP